MKAFSRSIGVRKERFGPPNILKKQRFLDTEIAKKASIRAQSEKADGALEKFGNKKVVVPGGVAVPAEGFVWKTIHHISGIWITS